jgi:hypothetical protein
MERTVLAMNYLKSSSEFAKKLRINRSMASYKQSAPAN